VTQGGAEGAEGRLRLRSAQPRPEASRERGGVEIHGTQLGEVERDDRPVPGAEGVEPAYDARPAPVRHHRHSLGGAGGEDRFDRRCVRRTQYRVRRRLELAGPQPHQVRVAAAGGVPHPVLMAVQRLAGGHANSCRKGLCLGQ
jgi:hypothetical protein